MNIILHNFDIFSAQDYKIELNPFPLNQSSRETGTNKGAFLGTWKFQYLLLWPNLRAPNQQHFWPGNCISVFYCHREDNKTLSKSIFNKKRGMAHPNKSAYSKIDLSVCTLSQLPSPTKIKTPTLYQMWA